MWWLSDITQVIVATLYGVVSSITDNKGNSGVRDPNMPFMPVANTQTMDAFIFNNINGGSNHVFTVTMSDPFDEPIAIAVEIGGRANTSRETSNTFYNSGGFQNHPGVDITVSNSGDDLLSFVTVSSGYSSETFIPSDVSWTLGANKLSSSNSYQGAVFYKNNVVPGTYICPYKTNNFTNGDLNWIIALKQGTGGGPAMISWVNFT